jgi:hypothetical protein
MDAPSCESQDQNFFVLTGQALREGEAPAEPVALEGSAGEGEAPAEPVALEGSAWEGEAPAEPVALEGSAGASPSRSKSLALPKKPDNLLRTKKKWEFISMKRLLGLVVLCFATIATAQEAAKSSGGSAYYPLKEGATWTYKVSQGPLVVKVVGKDKDLWKLETSVNGKPQAIELIQIKDGDGFYRASVNGTKVDVPVKFFKLPAAKGDSWDFDFKVQGQPVKGKYVTKQESVKVPAGEFKDCILVEGSEVSIGTEKTTIKTWFAENTGIVKIQFSLGGQDANIELEKYEAGK